MTSSEFNSNEPQLSADDQRLLDALAEAGFDRSAVSPATPEDGKRLDSLCGLLGLMNDYPVDDCEDTLRYATLARIDRHEQERAARMNFDNRQDAVSGERGGRRIRLPDFITVAAVILIAVSVLWPVLTAVRNKSIDDACAQNLGRLGYAFSQYAGDNGGSLPLAMAGPMGAWDTVKNVVNLEPLVEGHYCEIGHLNCPGHADHAGPSYSYRWFVPGAPATWSTAQRQVVILGDLNPVVDAARSGKMLPPLSMSPNHGGRGQCVLISDGATLWLEKPVVGRDDNIWLPDGRNQLRSGEQPQDPTDTFLSH